MKEVILNPYASSLFNACKKQALPLVHSSPPLELSINEAIPFVTHRAAPVPVHFQEEVTISPIPLEENYQFTLVYF